MDFTNAAVLVAVGIAPSLFWLSFYLKKDCHPEPRHLIAKTFLMGVIVSIIALALQYLFLVVNPTRSIAPGETGSFFLWAAFVEEFVKFLAVTVIILRNPAFDEPVDAMIYMVTAGLGFAAAENILVMFTHFFENGASATLGVWTLRFMGAILLHALSSAILGYFLAVSWFYQHHRKKLIIIGLIMATLFHFAFNTFLSSFNSQFIGLLYSTSLLVVMAFLVAVLFDKIRERHEKSLI